MNRASAFAVALVVLILMLHGWVGGLTVDEGLMLRPDSEEFVIGARSLLTGNGYRDLSSPFLPRLTRPIGTSILLAPVVAARGYDVTACRVWILCTSLAGMAVVFAASTRLLGMKWAVVVVALVALNPAVLRYSSELISETPYSAYTLFVLLLLLSWNGSACWPRLLVVVSAALLAEKTRSQGLALWPALVAWAWLQPNRKKAVAAVLAGFAASILFEAMPITGSSSSSRYIPYFREFYATYGATGLVLSVLAGMEYYIGSFTAVVFPPAWPEIILIEGLTLPRWLPLSAGLLVAGLALPLGLRKEEDRDAVAPARAGAPHAVVAFCAVYVAVSLLLLSVWPHRMGRLGYPLIPIVALLFWATLFRRLPKRIAVGVAVIALTVQLASYGVWSTALAMDSKPTTDEWKVAGEWLHQNTPPYTRVASTAKSLYLTARRQLWFTFTHSLTMAELNQQFEKYGVRYARLADWQSEPIVYRNPTYVFKEAPLQLESSPLWEVLPNRQGTVSAQPVLLQETIARLEKSYAESLISEEGYRLRAAPLLLMAGRLEEAETLLRGYLQENPTPSQNVSTAWMELGDVLLQAGRPEEAIDCYRRVLSGYNADFFQAAISGSIKVARAYAAVSDPATPAPERSQLLSQLALGHAALGRWNELLQDARRAIELDPNNTSARGLIVFGLRRLGEFDAALEEANRNLELLRKLIPLRPLRRENADYRDAYDQVLMVHLQQALVKEEPRDVVVDGETHRIDPSDPSLYVAAASKFHHDDLRGVALHLLEIGARRHPKYAEIFVELGRQYKGFGYFEEALHAFNQARDLGASINDEIEELHQILSATPL